MEIIPAEYDFSSMVHDIMNMISIKAEVKDLTVELFVDENLPSRLWGDDVRIRQILVNLLNNAVKYTDKGGVTLSVGGEIQEENVLLEFTVEDTGIGIKEEDLSKLFAEFERIEDNRNRYVEGTGLGMSITTNLLDLMGSSLKVESVYGKGSKFSFELKQKVIDAEPIGNLEERIRLQATNLSYNVNFIAPNAKVLIVDDNAVNRKVFVNLLKETKVQIDEASGGQDCLGLVVKNNYDIIFLDHMMPDMDGIETLHHMMEWEDFPSKHAPVIALTANAIAGAREMYISEGFHDFLPKPVNPEKLEKMLSDNLPKEKVIFEEISEKTNRQENIPQTELPALEGIDTEYALLHMKDINALKSAIIDFYHLIDVDADMLEELYEKTSKNQNAQENIEALRQYKIKVHSMKSSAAMIGAVSLSAVAEILEYAARDAKLDTIKNITPIFLEDWRSFKTILKPCIFVQDDLEDKQKADVQMTLEYLRLLESAMKDMDIDTADEIIAQLYRFEYPLQMQEYIETLGVAVTNIDCIQVTDCISKINEQINEQINE